MSVSVAVEQHMFTFHLDGCTLMFAVDHPQPIWSATFSLRIQILFLTRIAAGYLSFFSIQCATNLNQPISHSPTLS